MPFLLSQQIEISKFKSFMKRTKKNQEIFLKQFAMCQKPNKET